MVYFDLPPDAFCVGHNQEEVKMFIPHYPANAKMQKVVVIIVLQIHLKINK